MCCVAAHVDFGTHFLKSYLKIRTREHFLCFNVWTVESAEYCVFGKCPLLSPCSLPAFAPFKKLLCSEQLSYFHKYYLFHNLLISRADTICSQLATAQFPPSPISPQLKHFPALLLCTDLYGFAPLLLLGKISCKNWATPGWKFVQNYSIYWKIILLQIWWTNIE